MTKDSDGRSVYLLTYSVRGVGLVNYDVQYAYSYSPLGPYTMKLSRLLRPIEKVTETHRLL